MSVTRSGLDSGSRVKKKQPIFCQVSMDFHKFHFNVATLAMLDSYGCIAFCQFIILTVTAKT